MTNTNVQALFSDVYNRQFQDILKEFNELSEWVDKNFSDIEFTVEFNDDSQHPVHPSFKIKSRLFTGINMSLGDRMLKKHQVVITPAIWEDNLLMSNFIRNIQPSYKKSITELVNNWYNERKAKKAAGLR